MPLKRPSDLPKIPKTRKKKAEAALAAIPQKKPDKIEYTCHASFHYEQPEHKQYVVFNIKTIVEFTSFAYEISIEELREKDQIYIILMGLKAMSNIVPGVQNAIRQVYIDDLVGEVTVNLVKQDGSINAATYKLNIYSKEIELVNEFLPEKKNNRLFSKFYVDNESNTFPKE